MGQLTTPPIHVSAWQIAESVLIFLGILLVASEVAADTKPGS